MDNLYKVIWIDKVNFEIGFDIQNCYVTCKHSDAIEYQYFKPIFKISQSNIDI